MNYQCPHCGNLISVPDQPAAPAPAPARRRTAEARLASGRIAVVWWLVLATVVAYGLSAILMPAAMSGTAGTVVPGGLLVLLGIASAVLAIATSLVVLNVTLTTYRLVAELRDRE